MIATWLTTLKDTLGSIFKRLFGIAHLLLHPHPGIEDSTPSRRRVAMRSAAHPCTTPSGHDLRCHVAERARGRSRGVMCPRPPACPKISYASREAVGRGGRCIEQHVACRAKLISLGCPLFGYSGTEQQCFGRTHLRCLQSVLSMQITKRMLPTAAYYAMTQCTDWFFVPRTHIPCWQDPL